MLREEAVDAADEMALHLVRVLRPSGGHERADLLALLPLRLHRLVAADVDELARENVHYLEQYVLKKRNVSSFG